jgi:hypothetical protein
MTTTTKKWLKGLAATAISTLANTVSGLILLPSVFNFSKTGMENTAKLIAVPVIGALCLYLQKSPLSDVTATIDSRGIVTDVTGSVQVDVTSKN